MHYRDDKGKLMRKIPRVRCGDQAGVEKLLSKIDTGDYFAKKEEYDDDDETDDESVEEEECNSSSPQSHECNQTESTCSGGCGELQLNL